MSALLAHLGSWGSQPVWGSPWLCCWVFVLRQLLRRVVDEARPYLKAGVYKPASWHSSDTGLRYVGMWSCPAHPGELDCCPS